ncbi:hypothetical protein ACTFIV_010939 [Dictyostelium citrinum]
MKDDLFLSVYRDININKLIWGFVQSEYRTLNDKFNYYEIIDANLMARKKSYHALLRYKVKNGDLLAFNIDGRLSFSDIFNNFKCSSNQQSKEEKEQVEKHDENYKFYLNLFENYSNYFLTDINETLISIIKCNCIIAFKVLVNEYDLEGDCKDLKSLYLQSIKEGSTEISDYFLKNFKLELNENHYQSIWNSLLNNSNNNNSSGNNNNNKCDNNNNNISISNNSNSMINKSIQYLSKLNQLPTPNLIQSAQHIIDFNIVNSKSEITFQFLLDTCYSISALSTATTATTATTNLLKDNFKFNKLVGLQNKEIVILSKIELDEISKVLNQRELLLKSPIYFESEIEEENEIFRKLVGMAIIFTSNENSTVNLLFYNIKYDNLHLSLPTNESLVDGGDNIKINQYYPINKDYTITKIIDCGSGDGYVHFNQISTRFLKSKSISMFIKNSIKYQSLKDSFINFIIQYQKQQQQQQQQQNIEPSNLLNLLEMVIKSNDFIFINDFINTLDQNDIKLPDFPSNYYRLIDISSLPPAVSNPSSSSFSNNNNDNNIINNSNNNNNNNNKNNEPIKIFDIIYKRFKSNFNLNYLLKVPYIKDVETFNYQVDSRYSVFLYHLKSHYEGDYHQYINTQFQMDQELLFCDFIFDNYKDFSSHLERIWDSDRNYSIQQITKNTKDCKFKLKNFITLFEQIILPNIKNNNKYGTTFKFTPLGCNLAVEWILKNYPELIGNQSSSSSSSSSSLIIDNNLLGYYYYCRGFETLKNQFIGNNNNNTNNNNQQQSISKLLLEYPLELIIKRSDLPCLEFILENLNNNNINRNNSSNNNNQIDQNDIERIMSLISKFNRVDVLSFIFTYFPQLLNQNTKIYLFTQSVLNFGSLDTIEYLFQIIGFRPNPSSFNHLHPNSEFRIPLTYYELLYNNCCLNIISSTVSKKEVNLFGNQLNYAAIEIELDSDIFKYDSLGCPNFNCSSIVGQGEIDCSCDYTDVNDCPKQIDSSCPSCPLYDQFDSDIHLCKNNIDPTVNWTTIIKDKDYIFTSDKPIQLRYKADSSICEQIMIQNHQIKGFYKLSMGYSPTYFSQRDMILSNPLVYGVMNMCPSDNIPYLQGKSYNQGWTQDTFYFTLQPFTSGKQFSMSFRLTSKPVPPILTTTNQLKCQNITSTHQCLNDGEMIVRDEEQPQTYHYYSFKAPKSSIYTIRCPTLYETVGIFADDVNQFPVYSSIAPAKWGSVDSFENSIVVYLEKDTVIYIGAYVSWPTFYELSITSQAYYSPVNISSLPSMAAMFALTKSSRIKNAITQIPCQSWSQCFLYTIGAPYLNNDPISPLPPPYLTYFIQDSLPSFYDLDYDDTLLNPIKSKTFQAAFLLSYKIGSATTSTLIDFNLALNSQIEFLSTFFDRNGIAISNIVSYKEKELECNYKDFNEILNQVNRIENLLYNVTDLKEMNNLRYQLDTLTMRNSYVGCSNQAIKFLEKKTVLKNVTGTYCNHQTTDPEFETDPCCSVVMRYKQCCNPITMQVQTVEYVGVQSSEVKDQCSNPLCTESVIDQFYNTLDSIQDECAIENQALDKIKINIISTLRQCQSDLNILSSSNVDCTSDQDCKSFSGPTSTCDLYSRKCVPDFNYLDNLYLNCIFSQLDQSIIFKLLQRPFSLNQTMIQEIYNYYQKEDCINYGPFEQDRQRFKYYSYQQEDHYYESPLCLDDSCPLVHDLNYDDIYGDFGRFNTWNEDTIGYCDLLGFCNSDSSCLGIYGDPTLSTCIGDCNVDFCGFCSNNTDSLCHNFNVNDQTTCESTGYCMYPNGDYEQILESECQQSGVCSVPCGYSCQGFIGCAITNVINETQCLAITSTTWDNSFSLCYDNTILSPEQCIVDPTSTSNNYQWVNCSSNANDQCIGPVTASPLLYGICYLTPIKCKSKQECEEAGQCSDMYYFSPENTKGYPLGLGKCVRSHNLYRSMVSCYYSSNPLETEQDSPMGCFSYIPNVFTKSDCEAMDGYEWWSPAQSESQCLSSYGCSIIPDDNSKMLPYNRLFNEMDYETCVGCYESTNEWTNKFTYKHGEWKSGVFSNGVWMQSKWISTGNKTTSLDYQRIYNDLMMSANSQMSDLLRSEYFCRMFRTKNNLNSISCSCSGDGDSSCFKETSLILGETQPCHSKSTSFSFAYGEVIFSNDSVPQGCGNCLVSQYSRQLFTSVEKQLFPSNFVSYPKPEDFSIINSKDAIIGAILGDGVLIESQGVNKYNVCLAFTLNKDSEKYPIFDFASLDEQTEKLYPKGLNQGYILENVEGEDLLCFEIVGVKQKETLFPINHIDNWAEENKSYFDKPTQGLLYTLAVLFLLVSIYGFCQLIIIAIIRFKGIITRFELVHLLLLMIFIFVSVRMVYFFLLPKGYLADSSIADYVLVVLPTFFFFSCFTIIIVLWYAIVFLVLKNNSRASDLTKRVNYILIMVNVIIYLLLISIVIVFQYTKDRYNNNCGNRIIIDVKTSTSQKAVSIVYAVVQATISLVIGSAFIYLGSSLYSSMSRAISNSTNARAVKKAKKIFLLTTISGTGFILHCIFIIILVSIKNPSVVFSFIGLIITEIIPSVTILYCYDQRVGLHLDRSLNTKTASTSSSSSSNKLSKITSTEKTYSENLSSE